MKKQAIAWLALVSLGLGCLTHLVQAQAPATPAAGEVRRVENGVIIPVADALLKLQVVNDRIIRVAYAKDASFFDRKSLMAEPIQPEETEWEFTQDDGQGLLTTGSLQAHVDLATGHVSFRDANGQPILAEKERSLTPAEVQGAQTFHIRQQWQPNEGESLYGLGQHQHGLLNIKGYDLDLWQHNGTVIVPLLTSSNGYGILWDNPSFSRFGDLRPFEPIPADQLYDAEGDKGGLTATYFSGLNFDEQVGQQRVSDIGILPPGRESPEESWQGEGQGVARRRGNARIHPDLPQRGDISVRWEGTIEPTETGLHQFYAYSNGGIRLWIDDQLVMDHWRQGWLPWYDLARIHLEAGKRYVIQLEWMKDQGDQVSLAWKSPSKEESTSLWSEVADGIDYYFIYGPTHDDIVAGYRRITGQAPMMPVWAFGLWQSRQRYETQEQLLDVVREFRARKIPFDNIVLDWFYWERDKWGSHQFDPERFPDPHGMIDQVHDMNARLMISVWPKFYPGTANFEAMSERGFLYQRNLDEDMHDWVDQPYTFYDAFNVEAGKLFWAQMERDLLSRGVDAWWLDATEPDLTRSPTLQGQKDYMHPTAMGPGSKVLNAFALVNSAPVYEGQRAAAPDHRVFILTRSGFAGTQRYAAATWSGDITSTWTAMRQQIPAGISIGLSGIPYWTMDIGGFSVPPRFSRRRDADPADVEEWRELNARWFQFGTFVPLLRVHGEFPHREMWTFGGDDHPAYQAHLKFDRLRYHLLPYVYSLAGDVTQENGTIMRGLVMDFPHDTRARDVADEYLFGPALLVSPVTEYQSRARRVYLPEGTGWYDFWTGERHDGGRTILADAPYDQIPVHVKAGSILPLGPDQQYTTEKPADPLTLLVYTGADGTFSLYEDEGLNYNYEQGAFSRIPLTWDEQTQTLTLGRRSGEFAGMLEERTIQVVFITPDEPVPFSFTPQVRQTVTYSGEPIEVRMRE